MKIVIGKYAFGVAAFFAGAAVWAAPTAEVVDGKYVFTVPTGEEYTLTAADVATAMEGGNYACPFAKKGEGTLIVGDVMASYTNAIHILEGQYKAIQASSFGTDDGATYVDGGTIWSTVGAPSTWNASGGLPAYGSEKFHLKGTGYNNLGAIRQTDSYCSNFAGAGLITLDGDIRVTGTRDLEFRYGSVNCNSNTVTVAMDGRYRFRFVALSVANPGSVVVESGAFGFESRTGTGSSDYSVTIGEGAQLYMNNILEEQKRTLWLKDGSDIYVNTGGTHVPGSITDINHWSGDVTVDAVTPVTFAKEMRVVNFSSKITGAGGFSARGGGYLQFSNTNSTFAGGVCVTGKVGTADGVVTGGVSVSKTTSAAKVFMSPFAALPMDGGPVRIKNAELGIFNARYAELPDVYADGWCTVTGDQNLVSGTLKSLTKTGSDALTLVGPINVAGATDVSGGTLRLGSRVPDVPCGLNWYYSWGVTSGSASTTIPSTVPFRMVDPTGAAYAYRGWPSTSGANNAPTHYQAHYYTGYIRVPGEEGEEVTCNFVSSIARYTYLVIDGTTVVQVDDNKDALSGTVIGYSRMYVGPPVTLTAGWKTFFLRMGNVWNASSGPQPNSELGWVGNFGVGVDWSARCVTNSANYVKFLDPGDGSFLRPTLDGKADVDPTGYSRPTFEGAVAFGPGTVFDVNDATPYTPVTLPSLTGVPTITNGEVHVTDTTWTLRAEDVAGGVPLTVASGAKLQFAAGTAMALADEGDIPHHSVKTYPVLRVVDGGTLVNAPEYARVRGSKWFAEWSADGKQLDLVYRDGCHLIIR